MSFSLLASTAEAQSRQYGCSDNGEDNSAKACDAGFHAAQMRAALILHAVKNDRRCLEIRAAHREAEAEFFRGNTTAEPGMVPTCGFDPLGRNTIDYDLLAIERLCPTARWTDANKGVVDPRDCDLTQIEDRRGMTQAPKASKPCPKWEYESVRLGDPNDGGDTEANLRARALWWLI